MFPWNVNVAIIEEFCTLPVPHSDVSFEDPGLARPQSEADQRN